MEMDKEKKIEKDTIVSFFTDTKRIREKELDRNPKLPSPIKKKKEKKIVIDFQNIAQRQMGGKIREIKKSVSGLEKKFMTTTQKSDFEAYKRQLEEKVSKMQKEFESSMKNGKGTIVSENRGAIQKLLDVLALTSRYIDLQDYQKKREDIFFDLQNETLTKAINFVEKYSRVNRSLTTKIEKQENKIQNLETKCQKLENSKQIHLWIVILLVIICIIVI